MNYKLVLIVLITFFVLISGCIIESDSDGDGYSDKVDNFPNNANFHSDLDGDGYADEIDAFPNDASYHSDLDGDRYADEIDVFPDDANYHSNDEKKIDWQQGCYYYSPGNIFICDNYQATKEFIKSISSDQLEGTDVIGIAHTTGNYVLLYAIPELGEQVPSFAIHDPSDNTTYDIGYEKDVERLGITIASYEIVTRHSELDGGGNTDKDTTTYKTEDGEKVEVTTTVENQDDWCPVGTSWKTSNPTTGEEVSMVYTGTKEVDGIRMCVMEYTSTNPEDEVARVEYMFSEDSETFSWKSYYANGTIQSEMTLKDGKTTMIDENGQVTEFESN